VVQRADELGASVKAALDDPDQHRAERRRVADELFYCPGSATARAVQNIYELLTIPQPALYSANEPAAAVRSLSPLVRV
jgi:hypothetical protein